MDYLTKSVFFGSKKDLANDTINSEKTKENYKEGSSPNDNWNSPISHLIEPNIKYMLYSTLKKCHDYRASIYNSFFNLYIFAIFVLVFGGALYYCYLNKPSKEELQVKMARDQAYILSKIRFYQNEKMKQREHEQRTTNITNLPFASPIQFS